MSVRPLEPAEQPLRSVLGFIAFAGLRCGRWLVFASRLGWSTMGLDLCRLSGTVFDVFEGLLCLAEFA